MGNLGNRNQYVCNFCFSALDGDVSYLRGDNMKYRAFKRCRKYTEIYTREKETKELQIDLDKVNICIAEHQYGLPIDEAWVDIRVKGDCAYSMSLKTLIAKIKG